MRFRATLSLLVVAGISACADREPATGPPEARDRVAPQSAQTATSVRFATIGDYGKAGSAEADVAKLVKSWSPDHVLTLGDNNYEDGEASTIDANIGQYYRSFIYPYKGSYGSGASSNRFWPTLGNHDYRVAGATPYLNYFTLPGNERYYHIRQGPVHFFAVNSDSHEPDGTSSSSRQASWLKSALAASTAPWKVVFFHHAPYSSGPHGNHPVMQWPFKDWGAHIVLAGHDHTYERLIVNGLPYIVNGLGGKSRYSFGTARSGSVVRYNADYGAQLVDATDQSMTLKFYARSGALIDTYTMTKGGSSTGSSSMSFRNGALPTSTYAGNIDTYLSQNNTTTNYGGASTLIIDGDDPSGLDKRAVLKWDVSAIPSTKTVTAASITLNVVDVSSQTYELYQLKRNWTESGATWVNYASGAAWATAGASGSSDRGTTVLGTITGSTTGSYTIALNTAGVALVQGWVNGSIANHGVIIMDAANSNGLDVSSSEAGTVAARPRLTVTYR
jgi:tartrate-resistant acid phosphatase type 5